MSDVTLDDLPAGDSFQTRVLRETWASPGARLGLAWVGLVALAAVFAPFLANSHPLLMWVDGRVSSPALVHLTATDLSLLGLPAVCLAVWLARRRLTGLRRRRPVLAHPLLLVLAGASLVSLLCFVTVDPPRAVVLDQYRTGLAEGAIDRVWLAPVPYSPTDRSRDDPKSLTPPDRQHLMGTDADGADVLSRMIHACRIALGIGFVATGIAFVVGALYGGIMGFFAGWAEILMMRLLEIFESIPALFLLLTVVAFFGRDIYLIMAVIGLTSWPAFARYLRAEFLKLRQQDFVQAAQACGLPVWSILFRHMLPNGVAPLLVAASFGIAQAILAEAILSFLGLGLVDEPSWGGMLNQSVGPGGTFALWLATYPGLAIFLTVFSYNLIGEALRDAIDPHLQQRMG